MPRRELLIMCMTHMRAGICTAGFSMDHHDQSGLAWVRPVKSFGSVLLGDMTDADHRIVQVADVVEMELTRHSPEPPFVEDWDADFVHHRPLLKRRLEGQRWAEFLAAHVDRRPFDVLGEPTRSLCLIRPERVYATFSEDPHTRTLQARMGFELEGQSVTTPSGRPDLAVTDMAWRAMGRAWLRDRPVRDGENSQCLTMDELLARRGCDALYVSIGRSRPYGGHMWPIVVGVYPIPPCSVAIDYSNP